jgi:hypothetical protein
MKYIKYIDTKECGKKRKVKTRCKKRRREAEFHTLLKKN